MNKNKQVYERLMFVRIMSLFIILQIILISTMAWAQDKKRDLVMTPLFDNSSFNKELKTGWGYSCLIQNTEKTILFDVGDSGAVKNMDTLKMDPASIDVLIISHDHFDHTDGIPAFSKRNKHAVKYDVPHDSMTICENVFTTGAMGTRDPLFRGIVENALIIRTTKGLVIITGCAHPGIVNIVKRSKSLFPKESVYLVMGGFHLVNKNKWGVRNIVNNLKKEKVQKVAPSHCTGDLAESVFKEVYGADNITVAVGKQIIIEDAF